MEFDFTGDGNGRRSAGSRNPLGAGIGQSVSRTLRRKAHHRQVGFSCPEIHEVIYDSNKESEYSQPSTA